MFIKEDKVRLRDEFKAPAFHKNPPAVRVSVGEKGGFCLLITCKDTRQRGRVKKFVTELKLESDVRYKVRGA